MHVVYPPPSPPPTPPQYPGEIGNNGYAKFGGLNNIVIERFHSRGQHLCKFIGTKESVCIRKEFNSHRIVLVHQHACRFIVLGRQYGRRDVM